MHVKVRSGSNAHALCIICVSDQACFIENPVFLLSGFHVGIVKGLNCGQKFKVWKDEIDGDGCKSWHLS